MITDDFLRTRVHLFGGKSLYLLPRLNTASVFPSTGVSSILIYYSSRCGWTAGTQQRCNINQYKLVSTPDMVGPFLITSLTCSGAVASWLKKKKDEVCGPSDRRQLPALPQRCPRTCLWVGTPEGRHHLVAVTVRREGWGGGGALCTFLPPFNEGSAGPGCVAGWPVWELPIMPQW